MDAISTYRTYINPNGYDTPWFDATTACNHPKYTDALILQAPMSDRADLDQQYPYPGDLLRKHISEVFVAAIQKNGNPMRSRNS